MFEIISKEFDRKLTRLLHFHIKCEYRCHLCNTHVSVIPGKRILLQPRKNKRTKWCKMLNVFVTRCFRNPADRQWRYVYRSVVCVARFL